MDLALAGVPDYLTVWYHPPSDDPQKISRVEFSAGSQDELITSEKSS